MALRRAVVVVREEPPHGRLHAQNIEIVSGDILALRILDGIAGARVEAQLFGAAAREYAREQIGMRAELQIEWIRSIAFAPAAGAVEIHELLRLFYRQHAQHQRVHEREDGGIRADSQRQREHGGEP